MYDSTEQVAPIDTTIYVVERPELMPAKAWLANDRADFKKITDEANVALGHDLYACHIYETAAVAIEALRSGELDDGHNSSVGRFKLVELLVERGHLDALIEAGLTRLLTAYRLPPVEE